MLCAPGQGYPFVPNLCLADDPAIARSAALAAVSIQLAKIVQYGLFGSSCDDAPGLQGNPVGDSTIELRVRSWLVSPNHPSDDGVAPYDGN